MQSAITELNAIAVSAAIHEGWRTPKLHPGPAGSRSRSSSRSGDAAIGGHAFLIAGYNEIGFLVQNSWGTTWGKNGYATLRYEDWLDNAYDAWVARPGVPQARFDQASKVMVASGVGLVVGRSARTSPGYPPTWSTWPAVAARRARARSRAARPRSTASWRRWRADHDDWTDGAADQTRHVVLYAHGGLVGEDRRHRRSPTG